MVISNLKIGTSYFFYPLREICERKYTLPAAIASFHVEDWDVQALCGNGRKAAVGVAENQQCIGLAGDHQLVTAVDDVANGCAEIVVVQQRTMTELDLHPQERTFKIHLFLQKLMQYYPVSIIHQEKHSFWVD